MKNPQTSSQSALRWLRLGALIAFLGLLGWLFMPTQLPGAGGSVSRFLLSGFNYLVFLMPLLLGLNGLQARLLKPEALRQSWQMLVLLQIILALPVVLLFALYPDAQVPPDRERMLLTLGAIALQLGGVLLLKALALSGLGLWRLKPGLLALGLEALLMAGFWQVNVFPVNLTESYWRHGRLQSRMKTLQQMLETYAVDAGGLYPENLAILQKAALRPELNYWKDPGVQLCQDYFLGSALKDFILGTASVHSGGLIRSQDEIVPCAIRYLPSSDRVRYFIYGYDEQSHLLRDHDKFVILTNS